VRFIISRTSAFSGDDNMPIPGCKKTEVIKTSTGTWKNLEAARKDSGKGWFFRDGSFDHREENGTVSHDFRCQGWTYEVKNLGDLLTLINNEGTLVLSKKGPDTYEIEIYDGYRE
jgi:hypothetical protein